MPKLKLSMENTFAIGSTIILDSGEEIVTSIARSVMVQLVPKGLFSSFRGRKLYYEDHVYKNAGTALTLRVMYPEQAPRLNFKNPVLAAFSNAIWHCATAAQVCTVLNEAASKSSDDPENAAVMASIWGAYQTAQNMPPASTYTFFYANGKSEEVQSSESPSAIARWLTKSYKEDKRENDPSRTVRVVDQQGRIVWGK
jgi:hypothetical protein